MEINFIKFRIHKDDQQEGKRKKMKMKNHYRSYVLIHFESKY